jgi:hypothetical protein
MAKRASRASDHGRVLVVQGSDAINADADRRSQKKAGAAVTGVGVWVYRLRLPGTGRVAEL